MKWAQSFLIGGSEFFLRIINWVPANRPSPNLFLSKMI